MFSFPINLLSNNILFHFHLFVNYFLFLVFNESNIQFIISSLFATGAGSMILGVFDAFLNNFALLFAVLLECIIFGWIYDFDELIATLNKDSRIKVGRTWKAVIKCILPLCILGLWIQGIYSTLSTGDSISITIMAILTVIIIVVPFIFTKLPAKNRDFYK